MKKKDAINLSESFLKMSHIVAKFGLSQEEVIKGLREYTMAAKRLKRRKSRKCSLH